MSSKHVVLSEPAANGGRPGAVAAAAAAVRVSSRQAALLKNRSNRCVYGTEQNFNRSYTSETATELMKALDSPGRNQS